MPPETANKPWAEMTGPERVKAVGLPKGIAMRKCPVHGTYDEHEEPGGDVCPGGFVESKSFGGYRYDECSIVGELC